MDTSSYIHSRCKKNGCTFKQKENGYCGKHVRIAILERAKEEGKRLCNVYRGCFKELLENEKKCTECREKANRKDREAYAKEKELFNLSLEETNTKLKCRACKKEYESFMTLHKVVSRACPDCYILDQEREKTRIRNRNYQEEACRNLKSYWISFCRIATKKRNIENKLTEPEFNTLIQKSCFYCNYKNEKEVLGIDRLDNLKGYTTENCVTACKVCNRMKHIYHPTFFIEKASLITDHKNACVSKEKLKEFYEKWKEYIPWKSPSFGAFYTYGTKKRGIDVKFTKEEYYTIIKQPCYLCEFQQDKGIGIDRIDSSKQEYSMETCKACCGSCNMMKADYDLELFYNYMKQIRETHITVPDFSSIPRQKFLMGGAKGKLNKN
jgi:hypothetical protein